MFVTFDVLRHQFLRHHFQGYTRIKAGRKYHLVFVAFLILWNTGSCSAGSVKLEPGMWEVTAGQYGFRNYLGRESLFIKCVYPQDCLAIVSDSEFTNGIIEFDVAVTREQGYFVSRNRGLSFGAVWRLQDYKNYEEFYFKPSHWWNSDISQYTPVINGSESWQLYYGYGAPLRYSLNKWVHYNLGPPLDYVFDNWVHIRIVISGPKAEVFILDMDKPVLVIPELKQKTRSGKLGLKVEYGEAHFSNFIYTSTDNPQLRGQLTQQDPVPEGTIMLWGVSDAFDERVLDEKLQLTYRDKVQRTWSTVNSERTGLVNLSRVQGVETSRNCVFARMNFVSAKTQIKRLEFGFSDQVKVYLNDQLIYAGNNSFGTRDYRFLGTIGYFDELYLSLKKGENELWMAVCETSGGWGIQARFDDLDDIIYTDVPK